MNKKIAIIADNSVEYVNRLLKIWGDGNCAVLIDWRLPWSKIEEMLKKAGVSFCIIDEHVKRNICNTAISYEVISRSQTVQKIDTDCYKLYRANYSNEDALILFSSGTTGKAKGIVLSFFDIETNSDLVAEYMCQTNEKVMYIMKSLAHSSTVVCELLVSLKRKIKMYVAPTVVPMGFTIKNILKYKVTITFMNPTLLLLFNSYVEKKGIKFKNLKSIYISGSILRSELQREAECLLEGIKIYNVYGLTECGPRVSAQTPGLSWKHGSVGKALAGIKIEIRDDNGKVLGNMKKGCIWVYTSTLFTRYLTEEKHVDKRGFYCTRDVGYIEEGELFIVGRADNMILSGSHNIYPEEIEEIVNQIEGIIENVVISVEDKLYGSRLVCMYVGANQYVKDLRTFCMKHLASYEVPHEFICVEEIPKNKNGKILRTGVADLYREMKK